MFNRVAKVFLAVLLVASISMDNSSKMALAKQDLDQTGYSYLSQARQLFDTGMEANSKAQSYLDLMPNEDPRAARMLRDSINKATGSFNYLNCFGDGFPLKAIISPWMVPMLTYLFLCN